MLNMSNSETPTFKYLMQYSLLRNVQMLYKYCNMLYIFYIIYYYILKSFEVISVYSTIYLVFKAAVEQLCAINCGVIAYLEL